MKTYFLSDVVNIGYYEPNSCTYTFSYIFGDSNFPTTKMKSQYTLEGLISCLNIMKTNNREVDIPTLYDLNLPFLRTENEKEYLTLRLS